MNVGFIDLHGGKVSAIRTSGSKLISKNRSGSGQAAALPESVGRGMLADMSGTVFV